MVRFPFALPAIFNGMKIAMTMAVIGVIIGEFISAQAGLGFYILYASSRLETVLIFAVLLVLCVIGIALFGAVALAEQLCIEYMEGGNCRRAELVPNPEIMP
jgi:NitT/TauT family transport system permease protein